MIQIYINNQELELSNDIGLRLNSILFSPGRIKQSIQEFSFSFDIPATDKNNKILGFPNALPVKGKFNKAFDCTIRAEERTVFKGNLLIDNYDATKDAYSANAIKLKKNDLDSIFGDSLLNEITWYEPYTGNTSINAYNSTESKKVIYPFVSYGVFIKTPIYSDEVANDYTDRSIIDSTNRFYYSTFYPSLNMMELARKAFEKRGYDLKGTAMDDPVLSNIYMSCHLSDGQVPLYNLAQQELGTVDVSINWSSADDEGALEQSLSFPYFKVYNRISSHTGAGGRTPVGYGSGTEYFNFDKIERYNALTQSTVNQKSYMYDAGDSVIVIPADGAYRIELEYDVQVSGTTMQVSEKYYTGNTTDDTQIADRTITVPVDINETAPVEIQLVRNCQNNENNVELIKGKWNKAYDAGYGTTFRQWITCYPHENLVGALNPTVALATSQALNVPADRQYGTGTRVQGRRPNSTGTSTGTVSGHRRPTTTRDTGYIYRDGDLMAYDTNVNPYFICGASSLSNGVNSVIRNGKSWYAGQSSKCSSFYNNDGYQYISGRGETSVIQTEYSQNSYPNAPQSYCTIEGNRMKGKLYCTVWLNRNDVITLEVIHRKYDEGGNYTSTLNARLKMDALTPNTRAKAQYDNLGYYSESQFDKDLNMSNFIDRQTTAKSFIEGIMNAFNLQLTVDGNTASLDIMKRETDPTTCSVDIDNRTNYLEAISERIDWPKTMSVKYTIDTDEYGYWTTVPQDHVNDDEWKEYGDKGYDVIELDTVYSDHDESVTLPFSYTWYMDFLDNRNPNSPKIYNIPVISKYQYMAEGADYDEAMDADGYGLTWRLWFRTPTTDNTVNLTNGDIVNLLIPSNIYENIELSYRNKSGTLLSRYHDFPHDASLDRTKVDVYLSMKEYDDLRNGGGIIFDRSRWKVSEIQGFDPENNNKTTISMTR